MPRAHEFASSGKRKAADEAATPAKKAKTDGEVESTTIFVGNLSWNVDEDWLKSEFDSYGTVTSTRVITDRDSGRSKGFGYVEFADAESAKAACAKAGQEIDGRACKVDISTPKPDRQASGTPRRNSDFGKRELGEPSNTLFVGNLPFSMSEDSMWDSFSKFGPVASVRLPTDRESGQPKGFGYVEFVKLDDAKKAVEGGSELDFEGRAPRLDVSYNTSVIAQQLIGFRVSLHLLVIVKVAGVVAAGLVVAAVVEGASADGVAAVEIVVDVAVDVAASVDAVDVEVNPLPGKTLPLESWYA